MAMNDEETFASSPAATRSARRTAWRARTRRPRARGRADRGAGTRLDQLFGERCRRGRGDQRPRRRVDEQPDAVGQRVPRQPARPRLGARRDPAGAKQWKPTNPEAQQAVPDVDDPSKRVAPMILTTDLSMRDDPVYGELAKRFHADPQALGDAFRKGLVQADPPRHGRFSLCRRAGAVRATDLARPGARGRTRADLLRGRRRVKGKILESGLSVSELVSTAWASAASFRGTDKRGGGTGPPPPRAPEELGSE